MYIIEENITNCKLENLYSQLNCSFFQNRTGNPGVSIVVVGVVLVQLSITAAHTM